MLSTIHSISNYRMTIVQSVILCLAVCVNAVTVNAQTNMVDGTILLENQTQHNGVQVLFDRQVPSAYQSTVFSDNAGYYNDPALPDGIYDITYSKSGFVTEASTGVSLYSATTLPTDTLLDAGLNGPLSGTLGPGTFMVGADAYVPASDTLVILPGTQLLFKENINFDVNGMLICDGLPNDSIVFSWYDVNKEWGGIHFNNPSNDNSTMSYSIIEHSGSTGIYVTDSRPNLSHLEIRYNQFSGMWFWKTTNTTEDQVLYDLYIHDNEASDGGGLGAGSAGNQTKGYDIIILCSVISNNVSTNGDGCAMWLDGYNVDAHEIHYSIITGNDEINGGSVIDLAGPGIITHTIVSNNCNSCHQQYITFGVMETVSYSNSWGNGPIGENNFSLAQSFAGVMVTLNQNGDSIDAYGNMSLDPMFVNPGAGDYSLQPGSPCWDAGNPNGPFDNDSSLADIGACNGAQAALGEEDYQPVSLSPNLLSYPNPTTGNVTISGLQGPATITVLDVMGRPVLSTTERTVDMSGQPSGVYFLRIETGEGVVTKKVIRE